MDTKIKKQFIIDTHAHVNFRNFEKDREKVIKRTLDEDVFMINVGSQYSTSKRAVEIAENYKNGIFAAVGLHPIHINKKEHNFKTEDEKDVKFKSHGEDFDLEKYKALAKSPKVVAIGEVGLDYHHFEEGDDEEKLKIKQKEIFKKAISLANKIEKPMILHCWDAYEDLIEIIKTNPIEKKGVVHSFVSSAKRAQEFVELGFKLGFNGIITYSDSYNKVIKKLNLADILVETDCPYLTPLPLDKEQVSPEEKKKIKFERNEPILVKHVIHKIAKVKDLDFDKAAEATFKNAQSLFLES